MLQLKNLVFKRQYPRDCVRQTRYKSGWIELCKAVAELGLSRNKSPRFKGKSRFIRYTVTNGIRGKSGPPGNQNAFRHGLAGIAQRRGDGVLNTAEQSIRENFV